MLVAFVVPVNLRLPFCVTASLSVPSMRTPCPLVVPPPVPTSVTLPDAEVPASTFPPLRIATPTLSVPVPLPVPVTVIALELAICAEAPVTTTP